MGEQIKGSTEEEKERVLQEILESIDPNSALIVGLNKDGTKLLSYTVVNEVEDFKKMILALMADPQAHMQIKVAAQLLVDLAGSAFVSQYLRGRGN
ncbi:MAG: hypothetical protein JRJ75_16695 [Deltaproteobacteria bacterium]|nr:hypothetical protein [Deltaproteobacteria bacterium]